MSLIDTTAGVLFPRQVRPVSSSALAFCCKQAIISNRWELKSRRDLKVRQHFQARARCPNTYT